MYCISEIRVLIKTHSKKLGYILTFNLDCNVSWIYKHKDKQQLQNTLS